MTNPSYTISPARYAKGKMAMRPLDSRNGYKGRSSRLADNLGGRWSNRESAYIMSPAAADKLIALHAAGFEGQWRLWSSESPRFDHSERDLEGLTAGQAMKLIAKWQLLAIPHNS